MPIYEYHCQKCRTIFEAFASAFGPSTITCRHCGSPDLKKIISAPGIRIGTGHGPSGNPSGGCSGGRGFS